MAVLYLHDFTASNATLVQSDAPTTGTNNLTATTGTARIQSNRGYRASDPSCVYTTNETFGTADYFVRATWRQLTAETSNTFRLVGRKASANASYFVEYALATTDLRLYSRSGGTNTHIGSAYSWSPSLTTDYVVDLVMNGSSISVKLDGATVIGPVTDTANSSAGQSEFLISSSGTNGSGKDWHIDNFTVDSSVSSSVTFRPFYVHG